MWANITSAVTSRLRKYEPDLTYNDTIAVYACALGAQGATMFLGGVLQARLGSKWCVLLGGYILVLGTFLASIAESFGALLVTDGLMFGAGIGICYSAPIACAVRWLPHRKGLVTGIIVAGFGGEYVFAE